MLQSCSSSDSNNNTNTNTVSDVDGNIYQTVTICNETWTKTNLNVSKYRNGDVIPQVTNANQWANLTTGAWCYYNNDPANGAVYGKLYNWYAVNDPRGLAPQGWHVPSDVEWAALIDCLGGGATAGGKMKEVGLSHWAAPNASATNQSGFTALPGGQRFKDGVFKEITHSGSWWSSVFDDNTFSWNIFLIDENGEAFINNYWKKTGFSVRCLKN